MSTSTPSDEARRWLNFAAADLELAVGIATRGEYKPHLGCYHAQQAIEKALKAVLTYLQIAFPLTHDLDRLRDLIPPAWDVTRLHPNLVPLSLWVVESRYPGNWPEATDQDARDAAQEAQAVWETILDDLDRHGFEVSAYR